MRKFQTRKFKRTGRLIETLEYVPVKQFYVRIFLKKMYLLNKVIKINFIWITFEQQIVLNSTKDMLEEISYSPTLNVFASNLQKYEVCNITGSYFFFLTDVAHY